MVGDMTVGSLSRDTSNGWMRAVLFALLIMMALSVGSCSTIRTTTAPDGTITRSVDEEALSYQITAGQWILSGCDGICATLACTGGISPSSYATYQRISGAASITLEASRCALTNYQALKNGANAMAMETAFNDLVRIVLRLTTIYQGPTETAINSAT